VVNKLIKKEVVNEKAVQMVQAINVTFQPDVLQDDQSTQFTNMSDTLTVY